MYLLRRALSKGLGFDKALLSKVEGLSPNGTFKNTVVDSIST